MDPGLAAGQEAGASPEQQQQQHIPHANRHQKQQQQHFSDKVHGDQNQQHQQEQHQHQGAGATWPGGTGPDSDPGETFKRLAAACHVLLQQRRKEQQQQGQAGVGGLQQGQGQEQEEREEAWLVDSLSAELLLQEAARLRLSDFDMIFLWVGRGVGRDGGLGRGHGMGKGHGVLRVGAVVWIGVKWGAGGTRERGAFQYTWAYVAQAVCNYNNVTTALYSRAASSSCCKQGLLPRRRLAAPTEEGLRASKQASAGAFYGVYRRHMRAAALRGDLATEVEGSGAGAVLGVWPDAVQSIDDILRRIRIRLERRRQRQGETCGAGQGRGKACAALTRGANRCSACGGGSRWAEGICTKRVTRLSCLPTDNLFVGLDHTP